MPRMPLIGVRISWLIVVRKRDLASLAASARSRAAAASLSRQSSSRKPSFSAAIARRARFGLTPGAGDGGGERERQGDRPRRPEGTAREPRNPPNRRPDPSAIPPSPAPRRSAMRSMVSGGGCDSLAEFGQIVCVCDNSAVSRRGRGPVRRRRGRRALRRDAARRVGPPPSRSASVRASFSTR